MRLWHYKLIPVLPNAMLVSQWRECIAIKRQWEKGTLKHRLVSYVMNYDRDLFYNYTSRVCQEMCYRDINYKDTYLCEIANFCNVIPNSLYPMDNLDYPEHNNRYLKQCYYNLQEKYDRGIISEEEWKNIDSIFR
jgi:uncharacterized protein (TIGR02328 family)